MACSESFNISSTYFCHEDIVPWNFLLINICMDIIKLLRSTPEQILLRVCNLNDLLIRVIEPVATLKDTLNGGNITSETNMAAQRV